MITLNNFLPYQPSWFILTCLISTFGFSGCAEMSTMRDESNTLESNQHAEEQVAAPTPPTIEEVEEAILSTKTLLDDQQKQIGDLLSLRGEVKQTLREFRDQNLAPMNATIETLQQQVGGWENRSNTNQTTLSTAIETLTQSVEQSKKRVGVYGEQVTALVDQIDQNNRQYDTLLTQFQDSLIEFKGTMGEFTVTLAEEKDRAIQEEGMLTNQLSTQQQTLERVMPTAKEILDIQKRLNQLHGYINQVRDTVTSDTATLQTTLKNAAPDDLQLLLTSLEQRLQLTQTPSTNPPLTEQFESLEQRLEESDRHYAEKIDALNEHIQNISVEMNDNGKTQDIEQLHTLLTSLEQRYRHLEQTDSPNPTLTENLQALEQRVEQSEKQYTERVNALNEDIQKISVKMNDDDKTQETQHLHALVTSLEQRFQQLPQSSSTNPMLDNDLQALKQRVEQAEQQSAEVVKNLQKDIQEISATTQVDDTTQEMENLQTAVISLEQRYQQLGQASTTSPALTEQLHALEQRVEESEKHYAETVQGLHGDMKELSVGVQSGLKTPETDKLQALVASLEQRYQQLAHDPSSNSALTEHLKALEQRLEQSEIQSSTTIKALQYDLQKVSSRMATLTQSIGAETVEALHRDIQAVSAGMLKLAKSISHLEQTKIQTKPIQAGSITAPRDQP